MQIPSRLLLATALIAGMSSLAQAEPRSAEQQAFVDIYRELVEINTTDSVGDSLRAAQAMAERLRAGGFPAQAIRVISAAARCATAGRSASPSSSPRRSIRPTSWR